MSNTPLNNVLEDKRKKVAQMERELKQKNVIIEELNQKIDAIKKELGFKIDLKPSTVRSLLVEADPGDKVRGRRQSKRL